MSVDFVTIQHDNVNDCSKDEYDILLLNVRSLNTKKINQIQVDLVTYSVNFLCFTETWADAQSIEYLKFNNFTLCASYCRQGRGGGVAIFCKNTIRFECLELHKYCVDEVFEVCGVRWLTPRFTHMKIIIVSCYRPPGSCFDQFLTRLETMLHDIYNSENKFIICGDFNMDPLRDNSCFNRLANVLLSFDVVIQNKAFTRVTETGGSCIDHVYSDLTARTVIEKSNVISDHETLLVDFGLNTQLNKTTYHKCRNFNMHSIEEFRLALSGESWHDVFSSDSVDNAFNLFHCTFMYYFNKSFPLRVTKKRRSSEKWVNEEVKISSRNLHDLFIMQRNYPVLKPIYLDAKKLHSNLLKSAKFTHTQNSIMGAANQSKAAWQVINQSDDKHKAVELICDGVSYSDPSIIANAFNDYFL